MDTAIGVVCHRHATPIFCTFPRKPVARTKVTLPKRACKERIK